MIDKDNPFRNMKKKKRSKKELDKISCGSAQTFPTQLGREDYFKCPIWFADAPQFVEDLNKASDKYIEVAKKNLKKDIAKRNKSWEIEETWDMFFIQLL